MVYADKRMTEQSETLHFLVKLMLDCDFVDLRDQQFCDVINCDRILASDCDVTV